MTQLTEIIFADDMAIAAETAEDLQHNLEELENELDKINMKISIENTKTMIISSEKKKENIQ